MKIQYRYTKIRMAALKHQPFALYVTTGQHAFIKKNEQALLEKTFIINKPHLVTIDNDTPNARTFYTVKAASIITYC